MGWFTRLYARTLDLSGITREERFSAHGEEEWVFWINTDNWRMAGQCTPFGTILLNESRLKNASDEVVDYVFLHEVGHTKLPTVLSLGSLLIRIPLLFFALFGLPALTVQWVIFASSGPTFNQLIMFSGATVLVAMLILVPLVVISWLDEGFAELFVVSKIGETSYQNRIDQLRKQSESGVFIRFLRRFLYPPPNLVVWVGNHLDI